MWWWSLSWLEVAASAATVLTFLGGILAFALQWRRLGRIENQNKMGAEAIRKLERIRRISDGTDESIWSRKLGEGKLDYHRALDRSIPILLVANLKGGVGKTTIAANLAAHYASNGERVLAIDMDYQGTLSALLLGHARITDPETLDLEQKKAEQLLSGEKDGAWVVGAREVNNENLNKLHFLAADYTLADLENRLLIRWLLDEAKGDIRLHMADALLSENVQRHFDRIIIDTAPRLTLGFVASACCSTHVLIPTILNEGSSRSVRDSIAQLEFLRRRIAGHLEIIGVACSKTYRGEDENLTRREVESLDALKFDLRRRFKRDDLVLEKCKIRESAKVAEAAGHRLAYFDDEATRGMFKALADEIALRAPTRKVAK